MTKRVAVGKALVRDLVREAGGKCTNPGCPNRLVELHHIRQWKAYQTHDGAHMIALCPACHDAVHRGTLPIDDQTLYRWKAIGREQQRVDHLYVEPARSPRMLLGTVAIGCAKEVTVFELSRDSRLRFRIEGEEFTRIDLTVSAMDGALLAKVVGNDARIFGDRARYDRRPGRIRLTAPYASDLFPDWALEQLQKEEPDFASQHLTLLDLEVVEPGLVRVQGVWAESERAIVVTRERLSFLSRGGNRPFSVTGAGKESVIQYVGPLSIDALFSLASRPSGVSRMPDAPGNDPSASGRH